ncbi:testis-expressed protein 29 [Pipistrellus kuhlii]|uniref:testis-expressed protein 29 n=1 Tax=Pipistrellus kuhlii TaxID=59472 RepID=UPI00174EEFB7|nr:testis-expressed protein 29 [Pipistrellus kuhlii]
MRYMPEFKKSQSHFLRNFAVCDMPLDHICSHNSRDQCKGLGCCFHEGVCKEKSVSTYVHVFCAFILIVAGVFIFTTVYRVVQERKEKKTAMELPLSFKSGENVVAAPIARRLAVWKARTGRALPCAGCGGHTLKTTVTIKNTEETKG